MGHDGGARVIPIRLHRPVPGLSEYVRVRAVVGGGIELVLTVPGAEPVELHPAEAEIRTLILNCQDAIDFAKELTR